MNNRSKGHMIDVLFTLALFCVFAASALLVVMIGARVYKTTADTMEATFDSRTSLSYIAEKVRQNDSEGAVSLGELAQTPALVLTRTYEGVEVHTYIYYHNGSLTELLAGPNTVMDPAAGQAILPLDGLLFNLEGGALTCIATEPGGQPQSLVLALHAPTA